MRADTASFQFSIARHRYGFGKSEEGSTHRRGQKRSRQLGAGKSAVVRVVLYDKTKYYGYITETGNDSFVVADAKTGNKAEIAYQEVKGVKGNNFSSAVKSALVLQ